MVMQKLQDFRIAGLQKVKRSEVRLKEGGGKSCIVELEWLMHPSADTDQVAEDLEERT